MGTHCFYRYRVDEFCDEEISDEDETYSEVQSASVQSLIAIGERRGKKVRRLGIEQGASFEGAIIEGPGFASVNGFSLHANISCLAEQREKLEADGTLHSQAPSRNG